MACKYESHTIENLVVDLRPAHLIRKTQLIHLSQIIKQHSCNIFFLVKSLHYRITATFFLFWSFITAEINLESDFRGWED